jgi:signal transduction histidine kinase
VGSDASDAASSATASGGPSASGSTGSTGPTGSSGSAGSSASFGATRPVGRHAPPWWPEGEPWPPRRGTWRGRNWGDGGATWGGPPWAAGGGPWRARRQGTFVRRFGCLVLLLLLFAIAAGAAGVWAIATSVGVIDAHPAVRLLAIGGVIAGILIIVAIWRAIHAVTRPVEDLVDAAGRVEEGDFSARVDVRGPGDVRSLARAFNAMSTRLEETERRRRAYLADVTHELRTPLTVIRGGLEAIVDGVRPPDREHIAPLLDQVQALDGLIEDLRTLTLVDSGGLTLRREPVDAAVLVSDTVAALRPTADAQHVTLATSIAADLPPVEADPVRLRSVIANLLTNAIRHAGSSGSGSVTVSVSVASGSLAVAVRDTGPGFPPDLLPRVFDRFAKGPDSPGSGLGLAIARDLVVAHGGTIDARNPPDGGALVEFTIPLAPRPPQN